MPDPTPSDVQRILAYRCPGQPNDLCKDAARVAEYVGHLEAVVEAARVMAKAMHEWDMLQLTPDGHGAACGDAPWARGLNDNLRAALQALNPPEPGGPQ